MSTLSVKFALAATAIILLSIMPQLRFWIARGSQWQGAFATLQPDELKYSAYINALIDGRPRRNDPSTGQDDNPIAPLPESLFSIQFLPAYAIAWTARITGVSASTAFIALLAIAALLAALSIYSLLASTVSDHTIAVVGMLFVLSFGALAGGQGLIGLLIKHDVRFLGMPFLRRYEPALPFPFFFTFCTLLWTALSGSVKWTANLFAALTGLTFVVLLFSYFYLWTTAAAFFVCTACLWLIAQRGKRRSAARVFIIAIIPALIASPFYLALLSHLPHAFNKAQAPVFTHRPDLLRIPELLGVSVLIALFVGVRQHKISRVDPRVIFTASLALLPVAVLNQQVITGYTVQPYHYEVLILSYTVLVALVMAVKLLNPPLGRHAVLSIVGASLLWAVIEINGPFQARYKYYAANDEIVPVLERLNKQASRDGTWESLRERGQAPLVFSPLYQVSALLPTWAPQGTLLATAGAAFQSLSETDAKERLYSHFYYCRRDGKYLRGLLTDTANDPLLSDFAKSTIFGPERVLPFIAVNFQPIRPEEIEESIRAYNAFANSFSRDMATKRPLAYAISPVDSSFDFSNIDLWYERDAGERVGAYILYHLKLRSESSS